MVTDKVMNTAGRLNSEVTIDAGSTGTTVASGNCTMEPAGTASCVPTARSRSCVVAGSMTLVASVSTA